MQETAQIRKWNYQ